MRTPLAGLLFFLVGVGTVQAQDVAFEAVLPDTIVVTASRTAADVRQTGRRVTVWTAQDLTTLPVASFAELLRTVGGIEAQSRGGFGIQTDLTMRGSGFNGVLVLVDGMRLNDPMTGHFLADLPIPLSEIARIEVLRGAASALYGPDALGGVIQVFTYAGLLENGADVASGGSLAVQGGANALYDVDANLRVGTGEAVVSGAATWQGTDGEAIRNAEGVVVQRRGETITTDFTRQALTVAWNQPLGSAMLFARAGADERDFGAYHFYTAFASDTAREATATRWAQVRLRSASTDTTRWQVQLGAKEHDDRYVYNPQTPANEHTSRLFQLQSQLTHPLTPQWTLTGGVSASVRSIDSNNLGEHTDEAGGVFGHLRWQPTATLTLNSGSGLDYDPGYGWEVTPQASLALVQPAWGLRASAGRAVRAPNYIERYFNTMLAQPRGRNVGNPDLKAEQSWSFEAGIDVFPAPDVALHATAFYHTTQNLIDYVKLTPADTVWLARNLLDVSVPGVELDVVLTPRLGASRLRLAATYTWLDPNLGEVEPGVELKYALTQARHLLQGAASLSRERWSLGVQALWKDRLEGESYGVVHARAGYRLLSGRQRLTLTAEVRNLFDKAYAEIFDAPMPGRWWLVGLRLAR